jgi:hypothetical protein
LQLGIHRYLRKKITTKKTRTRQTKGKEVTASRDKIKKSLKYSNQYLKIRRR